MSFAVKGFFYTAISFCLIFAFHEKGCSALQEKKPLVLVSIAPHRPIVKAIADDTVDVMVVVPAGASSHTYEPTPKQMVQLSQADIWFRIGEAFEPKLAQAIESYHPGTEMVNMRNGVEMIRFPHDHGAVPACCHRDFEDIHIWLSLREMKAQASTIATTLIQKYPQNSGLYQGNLRKIIAELDALDKEITAMMQSAKVKEIMVSHPAFAYFARDYGFSQLSIEFGGKDPTPQQLSSILEEGKRLEIKKIFIQPQHSSRGAALIARHLGAAIVSLDPYSEDYLNNMRHIAEEFSSAGGGERPIS